MTVKAKKRSEKLRLFRMFTFFCQGDRSMDITDAVDIFTSKCCSHALGQLYYLNMRRGWLDSESIYITILLLTLPTARWQNIDARRRVEERRDQECLHSTSNQSDTCSKQIKHGSTLASTQHGTFSLRRMCSWGRDRWVRLLSHSHEFSTGIVPFLPTLSVWINQIGTDFGQTYLRNGTMSKFSITHTGRWAGFTKSCSWSHLGPMETDPRYTNADLNRPMLHQRLIQTGRWNQQQIPLTITPDKASLGLTRTPNEDSSNLTIIPNGGQ